MTKVTLPKDVAEAIEIIRSESQDDRRVLKYTIDLYSSEVGSTIYEYAKEPHNFDVLLSALVNGYQIEKSPEDKVREYYEKCEEIRRRSTGVEYERYLAKSAAIKTTLMFLGIKIEGINA